MRLFRKTAAVLLMALMVLAGQAFASRALAATDERVFDRANLFTASQIRQMEQDIAEFQEETGMDFVVLTSREEVEDGKQGAVGDDFYDYGGFGLDAEHSGVLYYIDMYNRWHHLSTTGEMIDYMTDARVDNAINAATRYLSSGDYADAVGSMMDSVRNAIRVGIPEGQYQYDVVTGERLTARHKALTMNEILVSAVVALAVGIAFMVVVRSRYQLKGSTYRYIFRQNSDLTMTDTDDTFLRTTTTRVRKPDPPSGGGGSFGGGGGGSGVHTGSSGTSHGGGGGRF